MIQDRNGLTIRNRHILHATARRDWVCGTCGSRLTTKWFDESPHWRTLCTSDPDHPVDEFIHSSSWAYRQAQQQMETLQASDVLAHLPPELQAAILTEA